MVDDMKIDIIAILSLIVGILPEGIKVTVFGSSFPYAWILIIPALIFISYRHRRYIVKLIQALNSWLVFPFFNNQEEAIEWFQSHTFSAPLRLKMMIAITNGKGYFQYDKNDFEIQLLKKYSWIVQEKSRTKDGITLLGSHEYFIIPARVRELFKDNKDLLNFTQSDMCRYMNDLQGNCRMVIEDLSSKIKVRNVFGDISRDDAAGNLQRTVHDIPSRHLSNFIYNRWTT